MWHHVTMHTSLLQNKLQTNTENMYVATVKNIHTSTFTYSIVTWEITLASSEKKEHHARDDTIQRHSFKCINHLSSHQTFPTTTRHVYAVLPITYAAHITFQILTHLYKVIEPQKTNGTSKHNARTFSFDSTSQRIHCYFRTNYKPILKKCT